MFGMEKADSKGQYPPPSPATTTTTLILKALHSEMSGPQGTSGICFLTAHFRDEETEAQRLHAFPTLAESFLFMYSAIRDGYQL